jgi:hypothetical protein
MDTATIRILKLVAAVASTLAGTAWLAVRRSNSPRTMSKSPGSRPRGEFISDEHMAQRRQVQETGRAEIVLLGLAVPSVATKKSGNRVTECPWNRRFRCHLLTLRC